MELVLHATFETHEQSETSCDRYECSFSHHHSHYLLSIQSQVSFDSYSTKLSYDMTAIANEPIDTSIEQITQ